MSREGAVLQDVTRGAEWQPTDADLEEQCRQGRLLQNNVLVCPYESMKSAV